jgi:hypothetical protein
VDPLNLEHVRVAPDGDVERDAEVAGYHLRVYGLELFLEALGDIELLTVVGRGEHVFGRDLDVLDRGGAAPRLDLSLHGFDEALPACACH